MVTRQLARWFGDEALEPVAYTDKSWADEPWTGGCPTGLLPAGGFSLDPEAISVPLGRLHFAGTETA